MYSEPGYKPLSIKMDNERGSSKYARSTKSSVRNYSIKNNNVTNNLTNNRQNTEYV